MSQPHVPVRSGSSAASAEHVPAERPRDAPGHTRLVGTLSAAHRQRAGVRDLPRSLQARPPGPVSRCHRVLDVRRGASPGLPELLSGECDMALAGGARVAVPLAAATSTRRTASSRRRPLPRLRRRRAGHGGRRAAWRSWSSSASRTRCATVTRSAPSSRERRSTTTARTRSASPRRASPGRRRSSAGAGDGRRRRRRRSDTSRLTGRARSSGTRSRSRR